MYASFSLPEYKLVWSGLALMLWVFFCLFGQGGILGGRISGDTPQWGEEEIDEVWYWIYWHERPLYLLRCFVQGNHGEDS